MLLTDIDLKHVLTVIEDAHRATTTQTLRQSIVYGVGALLDSVSCVWTELNTDLFKKKIATTTTVEFNDNEIDIPSIELLFNQYAWQHPVIAHFINTEDTAARSISDLQSRTEFKKRELYRLFFTTQFIEDQLSVAYVKDGNVKGLSVNRATWGFSENERNALTHIARCVFPFHRMLQQKEQSMTGQQPLIEANISTIAMHNDVLGITPREAELLTQVAQGKSNKQIATILGISEGTVRKHLENAFRRLGVNNRISAITKCMELIQLCCQ